MQDPTIPQWVVYLGASLGALIAGFVIRMGWKDGAAVKAAPKTVGVESVGLIDGKAADRLAGSIEGLTLELMQGRRIAEAAHQSAVEGAKEARHDINRLTDELGEHREEMRRHGDAIKSRR